MAPTRVARATSFFRRKKQKSYGSLDNLFLQNEESESGSVDVWVTLPPSDDLMGVTLEGDDAPPLVTALSQGGRFADSFEVALDDVILLINGSRPDGAAHALQLLNDCGGASVQLKLRRTQCAEMRLFKPGPEDVWGITLTSNSDRQRHPLYISELLPGGIAARSGRLVVGAAVTAITYRTHTNSELETVSVREAIPAGALLKQAVGVLGLHVRHDP